MEGIIHIAGVLPRIGTTTQALQLVRFLKRSGYEAAYVEMNQQNYLWGVASLYEQCAVDKIPGKVTYDGVDMYSKERLKELVSGGTHYDYLVCDFGNLQLKSFDKERFHQCGAMVLVAGAKPNEIFATEQALREELYADAVYTFSFIHEKDHNDIRAMMQQKAQDTIFSPYMPDPFLVTDREKVDSYFYGVMDCVVSKMEVDV